MVPNWLFAFAKSASIWSSLPTSQGSTNFASTWTDVSGSLGSSLISVLAVAPSSSATVYLGDESGNLKVSTNGGTAPVWARSGKELYYLSSVNTLMSVIVHPAMTTFSFGAHTQDSQRCKFARTKASSLRCG